MDNITLKDTVNLMLSDDYKERFKAEYFQTKLRYEKLHRLLVKLEAGTLDIQPNCPSDILSDQARHMGMYLYYLEIRAEIERIDLT